MSDEHPPVVAVVVPAHDAAEHLTATLESVLAQLDVEIECVVVDDGSTDRTADVAASFDAVRVIRTDNLGVSMARNRGIRETTAPFVAFCDADDLWAPDKLKRQVPLLSQDTRAVLALCGYELFDERRTRGRVVTRDPDAALRAWTCLEGNGLLVSSTALIRREALEAIGGFDPDLSCSADLDLARRLRAHGSFVSDQTVLVRYRLHARQMHRSTERLAHDMRAVAGSIDDPGLQHRAVANVESHLAWKALLSRDLRTAAAHANEALRAQPAAMARVPFAAARRRVHRLAEGARR